jgi:hypothetical protein
MSISLVERAQRGDLDAYEALARASARRLFAVASRILGDPTRRRTPSMTRIIASPLGHYIRVVALADGRAHLFSTPEQGDIEGSAAQLLR